MATSWFFSPTLAILLFFSVSAWHFGREDQDHPKTISTAAIMARGSLLMVVPALSQPERLTQLLIQIIPSHFAGSAFTAAWVCQLAAIMLIPIALVSIALEFRHSQVRAALSLSFLLLFAVADPLISFVIYFCGWHSMRGLFRLYRQVDNSITSLLRYLLPVTASTIGLGWAGYLFFVQAAELPEAALQTVFIGLSAIAVPHLLLHTVADRATAFSVEPIAAARPELAT